MVSSLEESFDNEEEHDDDDDCGNDNDDDCGNDGDCGDDDSCSLDGYNEEQYDHKEIRRDIEDEEEQESKDEGQQMTLDCNDQSINGNSSGFSRRSQIKNRIISRQSNPVSTSSSGSYQTDERLSIKSKKIQPCDSCDNQLQRSRSSSRSSPRRSPSNSNSSQISGERRSRRSRSNSRYSRRSRSNSGESRSISDSIEEENEASQQSSEILSDDDDDDDDNEDNESAQEVDPINIFNEDKEQQIDVKINQKNQSSRNNKQKLPKSQQILKSQANSHTSRNSTQQFIINDQPREATKISSTLSEFALEQACLQPLQDKLITYKKIKQSLIRNTNPTDLSSESITHKFLCEIIYDQFEEEKLIRAKYLPKAIGYLYSNFKPTEDRYLRRIIDDKELRRLKAIDIERMISRKEKRQHNSQDGNSENLKKGKIISRNRQSNEDNNKQSKIMSAANKGIGKHSYQQQVQQPKVIASKSKQSSQIQQDKINNNKSQISLIFYSSRLMEWLSVCKSKSNDQTQHQRILKEFHEKRRSLEGYQNCQILRDILQDILLSASISYYNNTKIAQLVCPLLLSTDISIKFFIKCLLRKSKHAALFIPPGRIITQLAQRHKSLLA